MLEVSVVPPEAGDSLHEANDDVVQQPIQVGRLEHSVVAKVVL